MQRQKLQKKRQGEHSEAKKTMARGIALRDIFLERNNIFLGLTKWELLAEFYGKKLSTILGYSHEKIEKLWSEIKYIKRYLRKKKIMAIISQRVPRGFTLRDAKYGERQLEDGQYIYYSCSKVGDALTYRGRLDKVARGFFNAGNEIEEIAENYDKQKEIMQVVQPKPN